MAVAPPLIYQGKERIYKPEVNMEIRRDSMKNLSDGEAAEHLHQLSVMLKYLARTVYDKKPELKDNPGLEKFMFSISDTLEAIVLKNKITEAQALTSELMLKCSIDANNSGYPCFVKDFHFLESDKDAASQELAKFPDDERLVEDALFSAARGVYPKDIVLNKMKKNYYSALANLDFQNGIKIDPIVCMRETEDGKLCRKYVSRFDDNNNMPRFYILYFSVPHKSFPKEEWKSNLDGAIAESFSNLSAFELPHLAKKTDLIEGVQIQRIDRYDIGPFYNRITNNQNQIKAIMDVANPEDAIILLNQYTVQRVGRTERKGLMEKIRVMMSGDNEEGIFSPVIANPTYALLPHRLIQKIQSRGLQVGDNVTMYGITNTGGIVD